MLQRSFQFREDSRCGRIGKMPVPGENALLDRPWPPRIFLQEIFIMIGLDKERLDSAQRVEDKPGRVTEIGKHSETRAVRRNSKPDGIRCVMRDRKRANLETANRKWGAGLEESPVVVRQAKVLKRSGGEHIAKDRQLVARQHHLQGACMVAMLMRKEDSRELLRQKPDTLQARSQLLCA